MPPNFIRSRFFITLLRYSVAQPSVQPLQDGSGLVPPGAEEDGAPVPLSDDDGRDVVAARGGGACATAVRQWVCLLP